MFERIFKSYIKGKKMDLIQIIFIGAVGYGLYRLVRVYKKKSELEIKPMAKVKPIKKKKKVTKKKPRGGDG